MYPSAQLLLGVTEVLVVLEVQPKEAVLLVQGSRARVRARSRHLEVQEGFLPPECSAASCPKLPQGGHVLLAGDPILDPVGFSKLMWSDPDRAGSSSPCR